MIKLIITSESFPSLTHCFDHCPITIGGPDSPSADLKIPDKTLQNSHIQINSQKIDGKTVFLGSNLANDPFATLNGLPFGRQPLDNNDLIQCGDVAIRIEIDSPSQTTIQAPPNIEKIKAETVETAELFDPPVPNVQTPLFQQNPSKILSSLPLHAPTQPRTPPLSLKDYYLSEYDEEGDPSDKNRETPTKGFLSAQISKRWRLLTIISASFIGLIAIIACLTYLWVSDQSEEEEVKAARGIADVAMALTYAQMKSIHPPNQNWTNPEFIINNLSAVIAPEFTSLADFDSHGQFANCPYMLRIYTGSDLTHFLVIAQPAPSLLHWLIPKASIIIDSRSMEMRKIKELKLLNRLLVTANNLDGISSAEISNLVKHGELILLESLAEKKDSQGFAPPKALGMMRPGADNLVYNAPRYYMLGETLLKTSLDLVNNLAGTREVNLLQQEIASLHNFPDLVLYSSKGIDFVLEAHRALATIAPEEKFLIAHLQFNARGQITSSHLLMEDNPSSDIAIGEPHDESETEVKDIQLKSETVDGPDEGREKLPSTLIHNPGSAIDTDNPMFLQLSALANARHSALMPLTEEMTDLLKKHAHAAQSDFQARYAKVQQQLMEVNREQQTKIFKKFDGFFREYSDLPAATFSDFIKAANLDTLFQAYLIELNKRSSDSKVTDETIEIQLKRIEDSNTWQELEHNVHQTNQLLQFNQIPDESRLVAFQNSARLIATQKLNQFILSSNGALHTHEFKPDNLQSLTNILKSAWINDPDTYDFYINEFELREL